MFALSPGAGSIAAGLNFFPSNILWQSIEPPSTTSAPNCAVFRKWSVTHLSFWSHSGAGGFLPAFHSRRSTSRVSFFVLPSNSSALYVTNKAFVPIQAPHAGISL